MVEEPTEDIVQFFKRMFGEREAQEKLARIQKLKEDYEKQNQNSSSF